MRWATFSRLSFSRQLVAFIALALASASIEGLRRQEQAYRKHHCQTIMNINLSPHRIGFMIAPPSGKMNSLLAPELGVLLISPIKVPEQHRSAKQKVVELAKPNKRKKGKHSLVDVLPIKSCLSKLSLTDGSGHCTATTATTASSLTRRKSVRFQLEADGHIMNDTTATKPLRANYLTPEDRKKCWWTKKELIDVRRRAVDVCRFYLSSRPDYRQSAIRMMYRCGAERSSPGSGINDAEIELAIMEDVGYDEDYDMCLMVNPDCRGLEKRLFNAMNLPFFRYKRSIAAVMSTQSRLKALDARFFSQSKKARLIASQYSANAKYAAVWAHKLATADAQSLHELSSPVDV
jgi:hypothetical protein